MTTATTPKPTRLLRPRIEDLLQDEYQDPNTSEAVKLQPVPARYEAILRHRRANMELEQEVERHQSALKDAKDALQRGEKHLRGLIDDPQEWLPFE